MKPFLFCLLFLGLFIQLPAQVPATKINELLHLKLHFTGKLDLSSLEPNQVFLSMDFDSATIKNPEVVEILKGRSILKVELYYTAFQVSESFSQPKLNRARFENIFKLCPFMARQNYTEWVVTGQTACKTEKVAKTYFHGFVITYQPAPTMESMKTELGSVINFLNSDSLGHDSVSVETKTIIRKHRKRTGYYLPASKKKRKEGVVYTTKNFWHHEAQYETTTDTIRRNYERKIFVTNPYAMTFVRHMTDTTIFCVLNRYKQWKDILFVCDVTGSMAPYTSQVLIWHKLNYNTGKAKHFTFFNDGDNMDDSKKKTGRTGGIYNVDAASYEQVSSTMSKAMMNGYGGDAPENNCEALLNALAGVPDAKEIVMIADNWANIKDISLAAKIHKPVHIIICGNYGNMINTDYLELARLTGGSVHTMESDLENLAKLNEGEIISIGTAQYRLHCGKFDLLIKS
jgi:hypothetical protein